MSTEKDIITFYNEREASEKNFDIQNNDFGWSDGQMVASALFLYG